MRGEEPVGKGHFILCIVLAVLGLTGCCLGQSVSHNQQGQYCLTPSPGQAWPTDVTVAVTCKAQIPTSPNSPRQYHLQVFHGNREITHNSTKYTVMTAGNILREVIHIHNFTGIDTGNYTCRAWLNATLREGRTAGEHTIRVVIDSSHTLCGKKREYQAARSGVNRVTIDVHIEPQASSEATNVNLPNRVLASISPLSPTTSRTTEYDPNLQLTLPVQTSTKSHVILQPSRTVMGPQDTPVVPTEDEAEYEYLWIVVGALLAAVGVFFMVAALICIACRNHSKPNPQDPHYEEVQPPSPYEVPVPALRLNSLRNSSIESV